MRKNWLILHGLPCQGVPFIMPPAPWFDDLSHQFDLPVAGHSRPRLSWSPGDHAGLGAPSAERSAKVGGRWESIIASGRQRRRRRWNWFGLKAGLERFITQMCGALKKLLAWWICFAETTSGWMR